ncbi:iron-sulfur cluster biosynthesis family protein [Salibacterium halotolerans]|uniref:Uncharacterized protein YneR n=1 Tax=Salibacterium halotolerans TaxID=1884432 RepID=A0A1I5URP1_9BACI|nr:iron-sulfur cluster biosynthesis family protein [Salibacterium halotolerans]SFP97862.1 Uncharacterized protein YneR [Salibacterium halotolerans]
MVSFRITEDAARLYKQEMELTDGDYVRLFVRVGGVGSGGYSMGVAKEKPEAGSAVLQVDGIYFFVNPQDQWYMDGMVVSYDAQIDLLTFENPNIQDLTNPR